MRFVILLPGWLVLLALPVVITAWLMSIAVRLVTTLLRVTIAALKHSRKLALNRLRVR